MYRDLRAGAASGWDYSSRWLRDTGRLASIRTTQFIPIDLNAFLFKPVAGANPRTTGSHSVVFSAGAAAVIYCPGRPF
ncbi:trehalase family glycosidase [Escherichia coli]